MPRTEFNRLLDEVGQLDVADLLELRDAVEERLAPHGDAQERAERDASLVRRGIIEPPPPSVQYTYFQPIEISGPPLSETIIEERR